MSWNFNDMNSGGQLVNTPWYGQMNQGQNPMQPVTPQPSAGGSNWQNLFGSSPYANQNGADIWMGGGGPQSTAGQMSSPGWMSGNGGLQSYYPDITTYPGYVGTDPQDPGIPIDKYGHEIPNPNGGPGRPTGFGSSTGNPYDQGNNYMDRNSPYGNSALYPVTPTPANPAPGMGMGMGGGGGTNPDAAYPKYDPGFLSQVQTALESPNGPYAGRQPGDYAPPGAPDNVRNPQTQKDWQDRFYWFAANPQALTNPSAPGAGLQQQGTVPWQQFAPDVYSDVNANRSFQELSGVVDDNRLQQAQQQYGWQLGPSGLASNDQAVAQATQMKQAHPEYSYQVYQRPDGTYGIAARELDQSAQQARGFYAPGMAPKPAVAPHPVASTYRSTGYSGGGGGGGKPTYTPQQIAQQQALAKYGAGAVNFAVQHMPTPTPAPTPVNYGGRGQTNSPR